MKSPEELNRIGQGYLPGFFGIELLSVAEKELRSRLEVRAEHLAPNGFLHAATVIALADSTCGYGTIANLPDGAQGFTTIELSTNFVGTAREGAITCEANPVHLGRSTQVWDARVQEEKSGKPIAHFRCTQIIIWEKK